MNLLLRCLLVVLTAGWSVSGPLPTLGAAPLSNDVEGTEVKSISLALAKRLAFERNWDLLAARSDVEAAQAQKLVSREFPNPTLSLSTAKINTDNHPNSTVSGNGLWERSYDTIVAVNQLFEVGGKRSSRQASARAALRSAEARLADARRLLDLGVTRAYLAVLLAEANEAILAESARSMRQEAGIAQARRKAGEISQSDQDQIEIQADRFDLDAKSARATARSARVDLEVLLGERHPTGDWRASDTLEQLAQTTQAPAAPGQPVRADWVAAEAARQKAEADLKLQRAMRIPDPTVQFQYEHQPADQPNTVGLGVSFPLPLWNRNRGAIASAMAARDQAVIQIGKIETQIAAEAAGARIAYDDASRRWQRYLESIRPRSAAIRQTMTFAYQKGGASLLDLLSAERNDNDVRLATAQAAADAAVAQAALSAALTSFTEFKP